MNPVFYCWDKKSQADILLQRFRNECGRGPPDMFKSNAGYFGKLKDTGMIGNRKRTAGCLSNKGIVDVGRTVYYRSPQKRMRC